MGWLRIGFASLFLVFGAASASADNARHMPLDAVAVGNTTFADLLAMVIPDLAPGRYGYEGSRVVPLRHVAGEGWGGATPEAFVIETVPSIAYRVAAGERLLLLIDLGRSADYAEGLAVLALYDLSEPPVLLDAVDVGLARDTGFDEPARLTSPSGEELILTYSAHSNSHQGYMTTAMLTVVGDRIDLVDTVFTFSERACAGEVVQTPHVAWTDADAIAVTVVVETIPGEDECDDPLLEASRREVSVTYLRELGSGRFSADTDALKRLAQDSEGRF